MDTRGIKLENEVPAAETPEDVAILYSWANLQGAKYRDFSASRREYRAQIRHRAALTLQERELQAAANAEAAAAAAERAAQAAEDAARRADPNDSQVRRLQILRNAEAAARKAAAERMEAARRVEAAAEAEAAARREEAEIAEAHASAERQALAYTESDMRRRRLAGPQPRTGTGAQAGDPYSAASKASDEEAYKHIETERFEPAPEPYAPSGDSSAKRHSARVSIYEQPLKRRPQGYHPDEASGVWQIKRVVNGEFVEGPASRNLVPVTEWLTPEQLSPPASEAPLVLDPVPTAKPDVPAPAFSPEAPLDPGPVPTAAPASEVTASRFAEAAAVAAIPAVVAEELHTPVPEHKPAVAPESETEPVGPAWLFSTQTPPRPRAVQPIPHPSSSSFRLATATQASAAATSPLGTDTLQDSRERVASRWFALKGVFEHADPELPTLPPIRQVGDSDTRAPLLAVFSLAGGVGKTSLVATLGRALSSLGEKVLLADTTSHGLLPFYFGARELRPGVVRTFSPPSGSSDAPIHLVSYDIDGKSTDQAQDKLAEDILQSSPGNNRILVDLSPNASWMIRRIAALHPTVLVPIAPDMNSVISLQSVEKLFQSVTDAEGHALRPFYLLNQFDSTLALHLDVREVFRRQLGERLLRFAIHRSPAVSEALAEGMTVVDYAPDAPVSQDYLDVAAWLRSVSPPATAGFRNVRWSER